MKDPFIPLERQIGKYLPERLVWQLRFLLYHRRWPNLGDPRTFNEKVVWRILHDRRPIFVTCTDKLASKELARERMPGIRVPETLWKGRDPTELGSLDLSGRWVLKPNNSTHRVIFGEGPVDQSLAMDLTERTEGWADLPYRTNGRAGRRQYWFESAAENCLLVEEFIGTSEESPADLKFFVFHGRVEVILISADRYSNPHRAYLDRNWQVLPVSDNKQTSGKVVLPELQGELIEAAEELSGGLDFVRVDLYEADGQVWFGELTPYSGAGTTHLTPYSFDREWGDLWTLPSLEEVSGA